MLAAARHRVRTSDSCKADVDLVLCLVVVTGWIPKSLQKHVMRQGMPNASFYLGPDCRPPFVAAVLPHGHEESLHVGDDFSVSAAQGVPLGVERAVRFRAGLFRQHSLLPCRLGKPGAPAAWLGHAGTPSVAVAVPDHGGLEPRCFGDGVAAIVAAEGGSGVEVEVVGAVVGAAAGGEVETELVGAAAGVEVEAELVGET